MKNHNKPQFVDFEQTPRIVVEYVEPFKREKDAEKPRKKGELQDNEKAGAVIGYLCHDLGDDGNPIIVGNSYAIDKAFKDAKPEAVFGIEFTGQKETKAGQKVNEFRIKESESQEDTDKLLADLKSDK